MTSRALAAALVALPLWAARADGGPSAEELELVIRSLRPEGKAELERNAGPLAGQPLYEVEAELDPKAARVEGRLRLLVKNPDDAAPWTELVLRLWPAAAKEAHVSLRASEVTVDGKPAAARFHGSVMEVSLRPPLAPGGRVALSLRFTGSLRRLKRGDDSLGRATEPLLGMLGGGGQSGALPAVDGYGTFAVGPAGAVLVDWYPQLAVRAEGRWDKREPGRFGDVGRAQPASAVVALTVPRGWKVVGGGSALGQHALAGGRETATFAAAGVRGPLGLAASPDYESAAAESDGVRLRASSLQGEEGARALLRCGRQALRELSRRFGPYPFTDLALAEAALTGGAGGIEQPGLALVARSLAGPGLGQLWKPSLFEFTCWHEVAHQWWQGVVGSDPRRAAWVDEALAQYSAALVAGAAAEGAPSKQATADALARHVSVNYQMMRTLGVADGKVARDTESFASALQYAGLVYGKAPLFYGRAHELLGDDAFNEAVRAYRTAWAFREAGPRSFLEAAKGPAGDKAARLAELAQRWLHQSHGDEDIVPLDAFALLGGDGSGLSDLLQRLGPGGTGRLPDDKELQQLMRLMQKTLPQLQELLDQAGTGLQPPPADDEQE